MIAFDTNVLLRVYVNDDGLQYAAVKRQLARAEACGEAVFIANPVICELICILQTRYAVDRKGCLAVLESLTKHPIFRFESPRVFSKAVDRYREGRGDFADYLIREIAAAQDVEALHTFDKTLLKEAGFSKP